MYVLIASWMLLAAISVDKPASPNRSNIRTLPVARTPESNTVLLTIAIPKPDAVMNNPVWIQFRVDGYALGAGSSQFDRAQEIALSNLGQTVHVVIDNEPYFPINEPAIDPFDEGGYFYNMSYKFEIPQRLKEGQHTIRLFCARSFGESLKGENSFTAMNFYIGSATENPGMDLTMPYITYNEPSNELYLEQGKPILLDFFVSNTELSSDGYKVRLTIDGKINRTITAWQPFYIYGLKRGKHTIRLELLDSHNELMPGYFNDVQQTITVH